MISNPSPPTASPGSDNPSKGRKRDFVFLNANDQELIKLPGQVNGNSFKISFLSKCTAWLLDYSSSVLVDSCDESQLCLGPVSGTVQLQELEDCVISVACKELKCSNCKK